MLKKSSIQLYGNDRYEGFGIELIEVLSKMLGFSYTFVIQEDGVYGSLNRETGQWNGMIKELLEYVCIMFIIYILLYYIIPYFISTAGRFSDNRSHYNFGQTKCG